MNTARRPGNMEQYILDHLEEALLRGFIRPYFQPVVRTLTRQYCGMEALARWEDPEYGLLMPSEFIGVLEKHRLIHKLDIRILNQVCETLRSMNTHVEVPVSVNFSRLDYELCDLFEMVEAAVQAHKTRRSSLCIEITESTIADNEERMRRYIDRFREAGYSVWMDDFGSGYSSLNVLKDFMFDELKIDMRFLSDFSTRSRKILASVVNMAKEIGIQTLAEGVETEEQFAFLRNIGCEKVQGYLFGRPMPYEECLRHVSGAGMTWELPNLRWYYDSTSRLNVLSARPLNQDSKEEAPITGKELNSISMAIVELCGDTARMLFINKAFEEIASAVDWPFFKENHEELSEVHLSRVSKQFQNLLEEAGKEGEGKLFFVYDNDYYEVHAHRLASQGGLCTILVSVRNLSRISAMVNQQQLDEGLRSIYSAFDEVLLIDLNELTVTSLYLDRSSGHKLQTGSLRSFIEDYSGQHLYPGDHDRFRQFMDPETLEERSDRDIEISLHLRTLSVHGSYNWKCYHLVKIRQNTYYLLIRAAEKEVKEFQSLYDSAHQVSGMLTPDILWENLVNHAELMFFWKDTGRRFVGASRSFLNYYHFHSIEDIAGKTDEDMGWHIHNDPYRDEEWKVLHEGIISREAKGNCLVQGEGQEIVATKMPVFDHDGKIIGLMGRFSRARAHASENDGPLQARTDDLTGLLNSRGLYEDLFAYIDEYELRGRDFARIEIVIDDLENINSRFGYDFGDSVIRAIGTKLIQCCGNTATVARVSGGSFTVLSQFEDPSEAEELAERIRQISRQSCQVLGGSFNVYLSVGMAFYSETHNRNSMADQADMRRLTDDVENISQRNLVENTGRIFHMFDEFPMSYAVLKMISRPEGGDAIVLYANRIFMKETQLTGRELIGRRISSFFPVEANKWILQVKTACEEGKSFRGRIHDVYTDRDYELMAYPVIGPGFCAFTFQKAQAGE